jgi:hypothetical protein
MFRKKVDREMVHGGLRAALFDAAASKDVEISSLNITGLVGEVAGEIYCELMDGEILLSDLKSKLSKRGPLVMASLGWLLREDKISLEIGGSGAIVKLKSYGK